MFHEFSKFLLIYYYDQENFVSRDNDDDSLVIELIQGPPQPLISDRALDSKIRILQARGFFTSFLSDATRGAATVYIYLPRTQFLVKEEETDFGGSEKNQTPNDGVWRTAFIRSEVKSNELQAPEIKNEYHGRSLGWPYLFFCFSKRRRRRIKIFG